MPCTYDLEVAAAKYFYSLPDGDVPLRFHFNGTIFYRGEDGRLQIAMVPVELLGALRDAGRGLEADDRRSTTRAAAGSGCTTATLDRARSERKAERGLPSFDALRRGAAARRL